LGMIDDFDAVIKHCYRVLKPKGVVLVTSASLSPTYQPKSSYWRFTPQGLKYAFGRHFPVKNITVSSYGNVRAGQALWVGMAQEDLTRKDLEFNDPRFPCVVTLKAVKGTSHG